MRVFSPLEPRAMQRWLAGAALVLISLIFAAGCNIFSPFHNSGTSDNVDDLLSDARQAMDEEKFQKAMDIMDRAKRIAPNESRVRYLHAVTTVKSHDIDLLDVVELFQPADDSSLPVDGDNERILFLSGAELGNLYDAFTVVGDDLRPLVAQIRATGRELSKMRKTGDVLMSYGISETLIGMLRVLDNDDTEGEFSLDDMVVFEKTENAYEIRIDDELMDDAERDRIIDDSLDRSWHHFVEGRRAFFYYYQYVVEERIWTDPVADPPAPLPAAVARSSMCRSSSTRTPSTSTVFTRIIRTSSRDWTA